MSQPFHLFSSDLRDQSVSNNKTWSRKNLIASYCQSISCKPLPFPFCQGRSQLKSRSSDWHMYSAHNSNAPLVALLFGWMFSNAALFLTKLICACVLKSTVDVCSLHCSVPWFLSLYAVASTSSRFINIKDPHVIYVMSLAKA